MPFKVININCQSDVGKKASLFTMCQTTGADIVIGTEFWLTYQHLSAKIFPDTYKIYIFTNNNVEVIPGISDHEAVYVEASLCPHCNPVQPRQCFCYKKADQTSMKEYLIKIHQEMQNMSPTSTEGFWSLFKKRILKLMDKHTPSKTLKGQKIRKPWIDRKVKAGIRKQSQDLHKTEKE